MNGESKKQDEPRKCYVILESHKDENGYIPCLVTENEPGYYPMTGNENQTPWYWGKTKSRAIEVCARYNETYFGITQDTADRIVVSSMKAS
jgi:hypothetical protein